MNIGYLIDRQADQVPDARAILLGDGQERSWSSFRERICRLAGAFRARGVGPGDRVALLAMNGPPFLETCLAAAWIGAAVVPLNFRLTPVELRFHLEDAAPSLWLVDQPLQRLLPDVGLDIPVIGIGTAIDGAEYEATMAAGDPVAEPLSVPAEHVLGIFYTGGTTGLPKGVMLTHQNLLSNSAHVAPRFGYGAGDVHLHAAPMFHLADLGATFAQLFGGGAHIFMTQFRPAVFCELVERHRTTTTVLAPTMIDTLLRDAAVEDHDLSSWRLLLYGGSPITETTLKRCLDRLSCDLVQGFGQTEATHTVCLMSPEEHRAALDRPDLLRSCGRPVNGVHLRIVDETDRLVPVGEIGELIVRAPTVMNGYWQRPEETAAALRGGWLRTGDLGIRDKDGFITLVDRKKDMIVSGAENVYSAEVENALCAHPDVVEAAVIAVPDEKYGERVHAVVVTADGSGSDGEALRGHCRDLIAGYKIPRSFEFIDVLPRTPAGKIRKSELRDPHWVDEERGVR